ncbi:MAG: hypothetical protein K0R69_2510 [Clostridia bacterium]|nr:hypothetical protein [Clostridia bacterium]
MRKMLLVFIMFGLCISFFLIVSQRNGTSFFTTRKTDIQKEFEKHNETLDKQYPDTPQQLIEINNAVMKNFYSKDMEQQFIDSYVQTIRRLYSEELLTSNSEEDQKAFLLAELQQEDDKEKIILIASKIEETTHLSEAYEAEVKVIHYTNKGDINRLYRVTNNSGEWKIDAWEDLKTESKTLEE